MPPPHSNQGGPAINSLPRQNVVVAAGLIVAVLVLFYVTDPVQIGQLALGLGTGSLIAAIALGIVLTYKGSGVVNFHNGVVAVFIAYIFHGLRGAFDNGDGKLYLPPLPNPLALVEGLVNSFREKADWMDLPNWPTSIDIDGGGGKLTFLAAFVVSMIVAVLLGLVFHYVVFRPLRNAPQLAKVVASIGIFIILQETINLRFGFQAKPVGEPDLGRSPIKVGDDIIIPENQLKIAVVVIVLAVILWAIFRFTRFGLATRAAAENEKGAVVLGFSPDFLAGSNWVLSTVLAGLLGILVASLTGLDPITVPLLIVPALGAALLGGFSSFGLTVAGGLAIGMSQALLPYYSGKSWYADGFLGDWVPAAGLAKSLPFLIIIVLLFLRGKSLPTRGAVSMGRLPFAPAPNHVVLLALLSSGAVLAMLFLLQFDWRQAVINTLVGAMFALSLVVLTGLVGQISLAQASLAGIAGFALSKYTILQDLPFPLGPIVAALIAAGFGVLIAVPALRVRGVNLAVVSFAAALAIEELIFKNRKAAGIQGALVVPPPEIGGRDLGPNNADLKIFGLKGRATEGAAVPPSVWFGVLTLVFLVVLAFLVINVRRSATGRRFLAVRSNERAAAAAGVSVAGAKVLAFGLAAFIAGIGGVFSGYRFGSVTPQYFGAFASLTFIAFAYLGGITSVTGAMIAGALAPNGVMFTLLDKRFGVDPRYTVLLGGIGLVFTAIQNPEGIAGAFRLAAERLRGRRRAKAPPGDAGEVGANVPAPAAGGGH